MTKYTDDFESFWQLWPGRYDVDNQKTRKVGKWQAFQEWQRLSEVDSERVMTLVKSGRIKSGGTRYLPDAFRWLNKRRWEDYT